MIVFILFFAFLIADLICFWNIKNRTQMIFILPGPSIYVWLMSKFKKQTKGEKND